MFASRCSLAAASTPPCRPGEWAGGGGGDGVDGGGGERSKAALTL